jgi:hypothetical protein
METGKEEFTFDPQGDRVTSLAFTPNGKAIVSATLDGTVMLWDVSGEKRSDVKQQPSEPILKVWFNDLASDDIPLAHRSIWGLIKHPTVAVPFIRAHTEPAKGPGRERIQRWLTELDHDRFPVRETASKELQKLGPVVLPILKKHLATKLSPEARERLEKLLEKLLLEAVPPDEIRASRVVEVLERIGTADARAVLEHWKTGDPDATLTTQASAALSRFAK